MFKKSMFGYSKKHCDALLMQIENDFTEEENKMRNLIKELKEECNQLKAENEADTRNLQEVKTNYRNLIKNVTDLLKSKL